MPSKKMTHTLTIALGAMILLLPVNGQARNQAPPMPESMRQGAQQQAYTNTFEQATVIRGSNANPTFYKGKQVYMLEGKDIDTGIAVPDGAGNIVMIPGEKREPQKASLVNARELKLKIRELAEQLIADLGNSPLRGTVALPTSFVNQDNFDSTSSFGRYISEQLFHEFTQRGFPIKEYRAAKNISLRENDGEFYLSREVQNLAIPQGSVVVLGTYYTDGQSIFVNARLVNHQDGMVLRTASLVLESNKLTRKMLAQQSGKQQERGALKIRDYQETVSPKALSAFDQGQDVH